MLKFAISRTAALPLAIAALTSGTVPPALAQYTVLYTFQGLSDGNSPSGKLAADSEGNLYGTADGGDRTKCNGYGCGVVFEVTPDGREKVLWVAPVLAVSSSRSRRTATRKRFMPSRTKMTAAVPKRA